ncbi:MAG: Asp-tRNA(Asn)/Glu-tRNA(Gln) amidotransferase subunit GatB [Spirochaetaceae bacterium]|jgi:aspartyl-tRNA(Asn)/glutamyl-tRNA(Gln) amidotransferase subunit B|nr:Asp-tRNA(Asn)/Glu-tRNA(Gln) amidotransferase subunit GatB [Spirochaetaceae bacterium]
MNIDKCEVVIGVEIHCQLLTKTKAFCACENRYGGLPDSRVCPVCLGLPGAMPRVSRDYVELGAAAGLALNCAIAGYTKFDRKHYFYPDLSKGYQITQYDIPLCAGGFVDLAMAKLPESQRPGGRNFRPANFDGETCVVPGDGDSGGGDAYRRIRVERIHLEEDAGKSLHLEGNHSYIDYNRCGSPLIEIVTRPDIASAEEAALFMQTVQEILRYVGVTAGNLEEGNMRCDVNINLALHEGGTVHHTPISEIKNLNSFRSIRDACAYETARQTAEYERNPVPFVAGYKNTLGWDEVKGVTVAQRTKNSFVDYRFVVEPDIKPFFVSQEFIQKAKGRVGELPEAKRLRFKRDYGLSGFDADTLTTSRALSRWFEQAAKDAKEPKKAANWILAELLAVLNQRNIPIDEINITPAHIAGLANAVSDGVITSRQAKDVFTAMLETGALPADIIRERGMAQESDAGAIVGCVEAVLDENPGPVASYHAGKTNVLGWLMGQVMQKSGGKANPKAATEMLREKLGTH